MHTSGGVTEAFTRRARATSVLEPRRCSLVVHRDPGILPEREASVQLEASANAK